LNHAILKPYRLTILALFAVLAATLVARPAFAQVDFSGGWVTKIHEDEPERGGGPEIGDYTGLPINAAARSRADSWDAEELEMLEHVCQQNPADYAPRGPADMRVWGDMDPLTKGIVAWHTVLAYMLPLRTIYMDGRPHPSENAPHTWEGFSTGEWQGDILKVTTTHLKEGRIRRNGVPRSSTATLIEYYVRHHDVLTLAAVVKDPVYLTEPLIRTTSWVANDHFDLSPKHAQCVPAVAVPHPKGYVAYHLPGKNRFLTEFASRWHVPVEAARGGAETMYPEYRNKLATMPAPPPLPNSNGQ
jgi:hypothetical protein